MNQKKPQPLIPMQRHKICPVCGEASYSAAGVHPQCAMRQADQKRMEQVKRSGKSRMPAIETSDLKPWQRMCPKCRTVVHCRKLVCECGHKLIVTPLANKN